MKLKIITHERVVFDGSADEIYARGTEGEFGILRGHVPFMSALDVGVAKIIQNGQPKYFSIMGGALQYKDGEALILTQTAEAGEEIDELRAQKAMERAKARLADKNADIDAKRAQAALARAMARLKAKQNN